MGVPNWVIYHLQSYLLYSTAGLLNIYPPFSILFGTPSLDFALLNLVRGAKTTLAI